MINYINIHKILFLFLCIYTGNAHSQSVEILFENSSVILASSRTVADMNIVEGKDHAQEIYRVFYKYYYPSSLEEYKSLFHEGRYPAGIENNYDLWRKNMTGVNIRITGILSGLFREKKTNIINFIYTKDGLSLRLSFFAKQIAGYWYPYEAVELMEMHDLSTFFPVVNLEVIQSMISSNTENEFSGLYVEIVSRCGAGGKKLSAQCFYAAAEQWGISESADVRQKSEKLFFTRINQPNRTSSALNATALKNVLTEYSIPEEEIKIITYYLNRGETMIAYARIQYHVPALQFDQINVRMKTVLQGQALQTQTIEHK